MIHFSRQLTLLFVVMLAATPSVDAQTTRPEGRTLSRQAATPGGGRKAIEVPSIESRLAVMREGSRIVEAEGEVSLDEASGDWWVLMQPDDPHWPPQEFRFMPCAMLEELERTVEAMPRLAMIFQLTGEVYLYEGRNYLLLTHPPLLIGTREEVVPPAEESEEEAPLVEREKDSTEDIINRLRQSVGPVGRRSEAPPPSADTSGGEIRARNEGLALVSRRGRVRRSDDGSFAFIFAADAEGQADPSVTLLPCLLLERIEKHVREGGEDAALITGRIYTFRGREYLLPTVYYLPRERTPLTP